MRPERAGTGEEGRGKEEERQGKQEDEREREGFSTSTMNPTVGQSASDKKK